MFNIFSKKEKYLDCHYMKHSIHFFYDMVKTCCTNIYGPTIYNNYSGEKIDWHHVYNFRKKLVKEINSPFNKISVPKACEGCYEINHYLSDKKVEPFENKIDRLYFHNVMSCNAKCNYCAYTHVEKGYKYNVVPFIQELIDKDILSKNSEVYMSGGEITIYPEFEALLNLLLSHLNSRIEILTNAIKYSQAIYDCFKEDKCSLIVSLDSGTKEAYKSIKQVDCFDKVVDNLEKYISASETAKEHLLLKYIIVDDFNDNKEEIKAFIDTAKAIGIQQVRIDIDYEKYKFERNLKVPKSYLELINYFNELAKENSMTVLHFDQVDQILERSFS
ncbi:MAG: radical SAM protein [Candidatus Gastranaerophilales bacterium]|nr:radical SAM protein [Candidatus Gastranaerophilales bacterium]